MADRSPLATAGVKHRNARLTSLPKLVPRDAAAACPTNPRAPGHACGA